MAAPNTVEVKPLDHTIIIMDGDTNQPLIKFERCPPKIKPFCVDKVCIPNAVKKLK